MFASELDINRRAKIQKLMDRLRSASEQGSIIRATSAASLLLHFDEQKVIAFHPDGPQRLVRVLFSSDQENQLYYATANGHVELVEAYLSILVLSLLKKRVGPPLAAKTRTMQNWLRFLKFSGRHPSFGFPGLYHSCRSSPNDETRAVYLTNRYSLEDLLSITRGWPYMSSFRGLIQALIGQISSSVDGLNTARKALRKPALRLDSDEYGDDFDYLSHSDDMSFSSSVDDNDSNDNLETPDPTLEGSDDFSLASISLCLADNNEDTHEAVPNCEAYESDLLETSDYSFVFDDEDVFSFDEISTRDPSMIEQEGWELMSEVDSVTSLATTEPMSYRDAIMSGAKSEKELTTQEVSKAPVPSRLATIDESRKSNENDEFDDSIDFDADFVMNGVKGARGGKGRRMFKGNSRTPKINRFGWKPRPAQKSKTKSLARVVP